MKIIAFLLASSLVLHPFLYAGRGGGGGRGGGHHGGEERYHGGGYNHGGHWEHHYGQHYGNGHWNNHYWHGPYYCAGPGWWVGGAFFVGFTFYTCTTLAIASTHTWVIQNEDVTIYNNWPDQKNATVTQVDNDPEWPYRICYNNGSCVRAKPSQIQ